MIRTSFEYYDTANVERYLAIVKSVIRESIGLAIGDPQIRPYNMSTNNKKTVRMAPIIEKESDTDVQQDDPEVQDVQNSSSPHQGDEEETTDHRNYNENEDNPNMTNETKQEKVEIAEDDPDTDLEIEADKKESETLEGKYLLACELYDVVPCSYFLKHMHDQEVILRHYGLGNLGAKAIAFALRDNMSTLTLDLHANWLEDDGGKAIALMLMDNLNISTIDLSDNRIGGNGIEAICNMLLKNTTIQNIDLSGNAISDLNTQAIAAVINQNNDIKRLNLSRNKFSDNFGQRIGLVLSENETIDNLDLSWNYLRRTSAFKLCEGIAENVSIRQVNLSMNGFDDNVVLAVAEIIQKHRTLLILDVSQNRISKAGALVIAKALEANEVLTTLRIGHNIFGVEGANALLKGITSPNSVVSELDISGIEINKEFISMKTNLNAIRPVKIVHGGKLSDYIIKKRMRSEGDDLYFDVPKDTVTSSNILELVKKFCIKNRIDIIELLAEQCKENKKVEIPTFLSCLKSAGLVLNTEQDSILNGLLNECSEQNCIDVSCFIE